jgi:hypothetical protein
VNNMNQGEAGLRAEPGVPDTRRGCAWWGGSLLHQG